MADNVVISVQKQGTMRTPFLQSVDAKLASLENWSKSSVGVMQLAIVFLGFQKSESLSSVKRRKFMGKNLLARLSQKRCKTVCTT